MQSQNKLFPIESMKTSQAQSTDQKETKYQERIQDEQFFNQVPSGMDIVRADPEIRSVCDLITQSNIPNSRQIQHTFSSSAIIDTNAKTQKIKSKTKSLIRKCWLLLLLVLLLIALIKSTLFILHIKSQPPTSPNLHQETQPIQTASPSLIDEQTKQIQKLKSINQQQDSDHRINPESNQPSKTHPLIMQTTKTLQLSNSQNHLTQETAQNQANYKNQHPTQNQSETFKSKQSSTIQIQPIPVKHKAQLKTNGNQPLNSPALKSNQTETLKPTPIEQSVTKNQPTTQITHQEPVQIKTNQTYWKIRQQFRQHVPPLNETIDLYEFKQSSDELVANSALKKFYNDSPWLPNQAEYGVGPEEHERAIRLMQVTHNVNFKGEFILDHSNHYSSAEEKYQTLKKLLRQQRKYFEQKYEISKYFHNQLRFCVFVTSYNNMKNRIYLRNLDSIFQQQYKNYHVVYVNDASTDGTEEYVKKYMEQNEIPSDMYTLINNEQNMLNSHNTYAAAHNQCQLGQIMVLVDGDDALIGRQVFSLLNAFYQREKPALVYTQLLFIYPNHIGNSRNQPINTTIFETTGAWRKQYKFCTSHLKTFYVDLFRMIKKEDLQFEKDEWIPHSPDVSYMTPMLQMAGHRVKFLTEITYEYRHDTSANEPVSGFMKVNPKIFAKKPYSLVKDLSFADNQITNFYP